ncbi:hypothetical protein DY000_02014234 [Brassica cretica]|uniref:Uncharacterized protein n=1 Tax=Brassica cretica TaxID=69181 RepID=A0ABQ7D0Q9_BRACR|nr:hypothetical protein DY000_02014234 [Brassica cretica]
MPITLLPGYDTLVFGPYDLTGAFPRTAVRPDDPIQNRGHDIANSRPLGTSEEEDRRGVKAQGDNEEDEGFEEEWLDFAMSETSLTFPHQKNDVGGSFGGPLVRPIPHIQNGIVIREPIIRLESPTQRESYRGKGKAIDIGGDSVGCRADVILPRMSTTKSGYGGNGESSRAVRHRLFEEPLHRGDEDVEMEESGGEEPEPIEGGTIRAPTPGAQPSSLYTWMRFQDSLHNLLNDQSIEPVLFARDAPPVIDSAEEDGK